MAAFAQGFLLDTGSPDRLQTDALRAEFLRLGSPEVEVVVHSRVDSTNALAQRMAAEGQGPWALIASEEQSAGRGRRGRQWDSGRAGDLYLTLLAPLPFPAALRPWVPLVAGLGAWEVLREAGAGVVLKWPNDLLGDDGAKLGGILVENASCPPGPGALAVGVGINVNSLSLPENATSLARMTGRRWNRNSLSGAIASRIIQWLACLAREGPQKVREAWTRACPWLGEAVVVLTEGGSVEGRFVGLDESGRMVLDTGAHGLEAFSAGDVSLRRLWGASH
ncbi:hypothetical protein AN478_03075 [Thiohalorhabdus denitrificans]|uniref:biotin--[biotin carboxyl-carrier protein] ligase n=1 Tax=Thiohalorhabdus denitrificans TaxID=381306 RepID=A0A0P9CPA0_9GAMM|nr:biotin--[acetyl-CoA-carboxylase] ligase [Thiohalorhabdus denitrificans]KPV40938.1 hypothetical protein AN478_03075 [Thiohalorhabdus denitrificans]SCY68823.1 BirA family transcriptional regulator, biotin operon repressor / biotin-[acetyl-CoA-carboxylase] ligase [Thiohalorhabdus denitrificans]